MLTDVKPIHVFFVCEKDASNNSLPLFERQHKKLFFTKWLERDRRPGKKKYAYPLAAHLNCS